MGKLSRFVDLFSAWALVRPVDDESARWSDGAGRWIALAAGHGEESGCVVVSCSEGLRERVHSFEAGLELAKTWRT